MKKIREDRVSRIRATDFLVSDREKLRVFLSLMAPDEYKETLTKIRAGNACYTFDKEGQVVEVKRIKPVKTTVSTGRLLNI